MNKTTTDILFNLKPAEVFLLLDDDDSSLLDYYKFILADLLLKKVLLIERNYRRPNKRDIRKRLYVEIKPGPNYSFYQAAPYEEAFFKEISPNKIRLLHHYLRAVQKESPSDRNVYNSIMEHSKLEPYFRSKTLSLFTGYPIRNKEGKKLKKQLLEELKSIEISLPSLFSNPKKICSVIQNLSGNIFHLPTVNSTIWKSICKGFSILGKEDQRIILNNPNLTFLSPEYYTEDVFSAIDEFFFTIDSFNYTPPSGSSDYDDWGFDDF